MSRIIAGLAGGRRLAAPAHARTRPTTDRVREAAFSLIAGWAGTAGEAGARQLAGWSFLDLYAGTGAVGLEAASRGASPVTCVEFDRPTAALARGNAQSVGLPVRVVTAPVARFLAGPASAYDVVWLDPPYDLAEDALAADLAQVVSGGWLAPDGLVVIERSSRGEAPRWPDPLRARWHRRYGETTLFLAAEEGT